MRTLIIGNSGSGKSTLARYLGRRTGTPVLDLDTVHWAGPERRRPDDDAVAMLTAATDAPAWIVEGVYGRLAAAAAPRATMLVWLDLPWTECRANLLGRGPQHGWTASDEAELLAWAEGYATRTTPTSRSGHERIFEAFGGRAVRLTSRPDPATIGRLAREP